MRAGRDEKRWKEESKQTRDAELLNKGLHGTTTPVLMAGESMLDEPYYVPKTVFNSRARRNKMSRHGVEVLHVRFYMEKNCLRSYNSIWTKHTLTHHLQIHISRCATKFCGGLTTSFLYFDQKQQCLCHMVPWWRKAKTIWQWPIFFIYLFTMYMLDIQI